MYKKQSGQILPAGLAMLVLAMLGAFMVFNTGRLATDKMRLANAADAAAYSGALWQARALNFQAYANRAMVANQVAVAQLVSLRSWANYGAVTTENFATVVQAIPVVNVVGRGLETGMTAFQRATEPLSNGLVAALDATNRILSTSQNIMYAGTFAATPDVVNAVVRQTDSRFSAVSAFSAIGMAAGLEQWTNFTRRFKKTDKSAMDEREQMINDSRDRFTRSRDWTLGRPLLPDFGAAKVKIRKRGKTELVRYDTASGPQWEWKAKDSASVYFETLKWKKLFFQWKLEFRSQEVLPIGWGQAFANSKSQSRTLEGPGCGRFLAVKPCRAYTQNTIAEGLSDANMPSPVKRLASRSSIRGYTGIQPYRSLSAETIAKDDPRLRLKIQVVLPDENASEPRSINITGTAATTDRRLSSLSVAEVFFDRPDVWSNAGKRIEIANGYNPYWGARLTNVSIADQALAMSLDSMTDEDSE